MNETCPCTQEGWPPKGRRGRSIKLGGPPHTGLCFKATVLHLRCSRRWVEYIWKKYMTKSLSWIRQIQMRENRHVHANIHLGLLGILVFICLFVVSPYPIAKSNCKIQNPKYFQNILFVCSCLSVVYLSTYLLDKMDGRMQDLLLTSCTSVLIYSFWWKLSSILMMSLLLKSFFSHLLSLWISLLIISWLYWMTYHIWNLTGAFKHLSFWN